MIEYHTNLQQEIALEAGREGADKSLPTAFTEHLVATMTEGGFVDDGDIALYEARGMRASGYSVDADDAVLSVFVTDYLATPIIRSLGKSEIETAFRRLATFVTKAHAGLWRDLEESSGVWDMAQRIDDVWPELVRINLILLTNGHAKGAVPGDTEIEGVPCNHQVWDIERLYRLETSGRQQEPITIDLLAIAGEPIPCLGPAGEPGDYESYLLLIPGPVLADIYERYRTRLLELNVRSFLQSRGKINRGIQTTLRTEPSRFLAYNNGISITASKIDTVSENGRCTAVCTIHDMQIVNGGQTTASLHHARTKGKLDISKVVIQAKLSVVEPETLNELIPRISEYSNSQNKVNMADFSATDPFHVELEKLSRTVWAPAQDGSSQLTKWFYERARGQYADAVAMETTLAKRRKFQQLHPYVQMIRKTDVAKFEITWDQLPHIVSLGSEKCFREFTLRLKGRSSFVPDIDYFKRLIAKAILFRTADKIIGALRLGAYTSQTVTYTLSLIYKRTAQRIDLDAIWNAQSLSDAHRMALEELAPKVHAILLKAAGRANISEWAKKPACWDEMREVTWQPGVPLQKELVAIDGRIHQKAASLAEILTPAEQESVDQVVRISSETWFSLAQWAKETDTLSSWQRSLAFSLGRLADQGRPPSRKQAIQGEKILIEAGRLGFAVQY